LERDRAGLRKTGSRRKEWHRSARAPRAGEERLGSAMASPSIVGRLATSTGTRRPREGESVRSGRPHPGRAPCPPPGSGWGSCDCRPGARERRAAAQSWDRPGPRSSAAEASGAPPHRPLRIPLCLWDESCRQKPCWKASAGGGGRPWPVAIGNTAWHPGMDPRALIEHGRSGKIKARSCTVGCVLFPMQQTGLSSSGDDADGLPAITA
jgi:hypothetical protein